MSNPLYNKDIISISDLSLEEIELALLTSQKIKKNFGKRLNHPKILASCFYEPSTRTRLSFESAMLKIGGQVIGFTKPSETSSQKGESLSDSMKIISNYADIIVLRHPKEGAARLAADAASVPVINAGDGSNQHPTQTLLDLFSIQESQERLEGLKIAFVGDLKFGRTVHSLAKAAALYDMRMYFISPKDLMLPDSIADELRKKAVRYSFHRTIHEVLSKVDIIYMTRPQRERFGNLTLSQSSSYQLTKEMLKNVKKNLKILHPLPRLEEIPKEIDDTPYAYYFQQAQNGLYVRQALLDLLLGGECE